MSLEWNQNVMLPDRQVVLDTYSGTSEGYALPSRWYVGFVTCIWATAVVLSKPWQGTKWGYGLSLILTY